MSSPDRAAELAVRAAGGDDAAARELVTIMRPLVSAMLVVAGAQAGLPVDRIDDAVMAVDLLLGPRRAARTVGMTVRPGLIEIAVSDVDASSFEGQRQMLAVLATGIEVQDGGVRLRVEP